MRWLMKLFVLAGAALLVLTGGGAAGAQVLPPGTDSDCAGQVPIVVGSDAAAQSDIYAAVMLAGVLDTSCVVLAGPRGDAMEPVQRRRLVAANASGWVVGGTAAVPDWKTAGFNLKRLGGVDRWHTARLVGAVAANPRGNVAALTAATAPSAVASGTAGRVSSGLRQSQATPAVDANAAAAAACNDVGCIFRLARERRERIVNELTAKINAGEYGIGADGVLRGPAGFEVDLRACPADWNNTGGITGSQIRIGHTTAQSGALAAYGNIAVGWNNYLNWVNENDPLTFPDGSTRDVVLVVRDDAYVAARTIEFVDDLIERENVFSILTLGSPNTLATYDTINDECIPQPFVMTGHPAWGDPREHPWTTGLQLSYSTEAVLWGQWIKENLASQLPVTVAGLVMDNDFGLSYEQGFERWARENSDVVANFIPIRHDPAAPRITNEMSAIRASAPDVFISMTAGNACLLAVQEAEWSGLNDIVDAAFAPSVCKGIEAYMKPAGGAGHGWWIVGGGAKDTSDPSYIREPFISWVNDNLDAGGLNASISLYGTGYWYGYPYVESLRIAAALPGGLTRTNFILAVRSVDLYHPMLLSGLTFQLDGASDAFAVEGSDFSQYDAFRHVWNLVSVVDVNGQTPTCSWRWSYGCA